MIELLSADRCIDCNKCVEICPTNVFDAAPDGPPVIARQSDCQSCFMCEAYCPVDALFVAPDRLPVAAGSEYRDEETLAADGRLGAYRVWIGWGKGRRPGSLRDTNARLPELMAEHLPGATVQ
ncbi:ferredoxin family protein [Nocardioides sp.]|uniref:4Fe-4S dicluster domain-containing protein n=1 Tax=Nocardioides sp. TaxID=35761 RepID=UPI00260C3CDA|nr:ferredoxin family protein [Nocardioides sp.]